MQLHFRESLPWLGGGVAILVGLVAIATAMAGGSDESVGGWVAMLFWILMVPGAVFIVKGLLVMIEELQTPAALILAFMAVPLAVVAVVLHNVVSVLLGFEEAFFFMIALFGAPLLLIAGVIRAFRPGSSGHGRTRLRSA